MNKRLIKTLIVTGLIAGALNIESAFALNITGAIGSTGQGQLTQRLGIENQWSHKVLGGTFDGYWDLGLTYWGSGDKASARQSISFAPVFVYEFGNGPWVPYVEAGVGLAAFTGTEVGDRNLGSSVHFEDRLGAGVKMYDGSKFGLRVIHYSNAGIKEPNAGIESYSFFYSMPI